MIRTTHRRVNESFIGATSLLLFQGTKLNKPLGCYSRFQYTRAHKRYISHAHTIEQRRKRQQSCRNREKVAHNAEFAFEVGLDRHKFSNITKLSVKGELLYPKTTVQLWV